MSETQKWWKAGDEVEVRVPGGSWENGIIDGCVGIPEKGAPGVFWVRYCGDGSYSRLSGKYIRSRRHVNIRSRAVDGSL